MKCPWCSMLRIIFKCYFRRIRYKGGGVQGVSFLSLLIRAVEFHTLFLHPPYFIDNCIGAEIENAKYL